MYDAPVKRRTYRIGDHIILGSRFNLPEGEWRDPRDQTRMNRGAYPDLWEELSFRYDWDDYDCHRNLIRTFTLPLIATPPGKIAFIRVR